jgi:hypothetical protein
MGFELVAIYGTVANPMALPAGPKSSQETIGATLCFNIFNLN